MLSALFFLTTSLFTLDLFVPDMLPFADEILLGLTTMLLAMRSNPVRSDPPCGDGPPAASEG